MTDQLATTRPAPSTFDNLNVGLAGQPSSTLDVRALHPRDRHELIFATLRGLSAGDSFELINDHDPSPLRAHLESDEDNTYSWSVLEAGPQTWRIAIGRPAADSAAPVKACCGCCGGGH
jgi:uncharacterized protein (DUF2249 family)